MRIRLNLATTPLENDRRFVFGYALVGTLAIIALFGLSWRAYSVRRANEARRLEIAGLENDLSRMSAQRADLESFFGDARIAQVMDRSAFLNGMIQDRSFPWTSIFMD